MTPSSPAAAAEQTDFRKLKAKIDRLVAEKGLTKKVETAIEKRGLAVRVLTDGLLFDSGTADVKPAAAPLLTKIGVILVDRQGRTRSASRATPTTCRSAGRSRRTGSSRRPAPRASCASCSARR